MSSQAQPTSEHLHHPAAAALLKQHPDIKAIDLLISDLNGVTRGKRIECSALDHALEDGINMPASIFSLDITGKTVEDCGLGLHIGEPDKLCQLVTESLTLAPWQRRPTAQALMSMHEPDGTPYFADPRHVLSQISKRLTDIGLTPVVAVELEFYLIDPQRDNKGFPQPPISPRTGQREEHTQVYAINILDEYSAFLEDIATYTAAQNIPADTAVAEYAPGQFEINLKHQDDPLAACDNAILLKRVIKAVAEKHGMEASFMAKPYEEEAGSGTHIHVSLVDAAGNNVLAEEGQDYSQQMEHAIAGLLEFMPASMAFFCPNVNSYRRMRPEYYVPMAPNWGVDNRTTSLRIPASGNKAKRIEHRVSGADANPYLVMAAILAGIHYGLSQKLQPAKPRIEGNAFAQDGTGLPTRMHDALSKMAGSALLEDYFGKPFIDLYTTCKQEELSEFERHVTALESQWFLTTV